MRRAARSIRRACTGRSATSNGRCSSVTLGIYYLLPFVRWDRGPNAPSQAVLIDFPNRRFYFFFIEIWPQEIYYLTGLLILAAIVLFLMNAVAGRVWCGYLCPQTVWTDLFFAIERLVEGDRREHMQRDVRKWTAATYARKGTQAFPLADGGLVDRRRLGSLFRRRADVGEGPCDRRKPRSSPMPGSAFLPSRLIRLPATCASRSVFICVRGRASRRHSLTNTRSMSPTAMTAASRAVRSRRPSNCARKRSRPATASIACNACMSARPASISAAAPISAASSAGCASMPATQS